MSYWSSWKRSHSSLFFWDAFLFTTFNFLSLFCLLLLLPVLAISNLVEVVELCKKLGVANVIKIATTLPGSCYFACCTALFCFIFFWHPALALFVLRFFAKGNKPKMEVTLGRGPKGMILTGYRRKKLMELFDRVAKNSQVPIEVLRNVCPELYLLSAFSLAHSLYLFMAFLLLLLFLFFSVAQCCDCF